MMYEHQIDYSKVLGYDRTRQLIKSRFSMDLVGKIKPRIGGGTYIFMLCNYTGEKTDLFKELNDSIISERDDLRKEVLSLKIQMVKIRNSVLHYIKHPQEYQK